MMSPALRSDEDYEQSLLVDADTEITLTVTPSEGKVVFQRRGATYEEPESFALSSGLPEGLCLTRRELHSDWC